jgi:hypothetical protein
MNEIENTFIIFGVLIIFICVPTLCLCYNKKKDYIKINSISIDNSKYSDA